jgi:protoporphyrinogen IX oxidase
MYLWLKSLHLIAVISWMAGLLYLPRLMIYHCDAAKGSELSETLKTMERRLLRYIMRPAMIVSWLAGLTLAFVYVGFSGGYWLYLKFAFVISLTVAHEKMAIWVNDFAADNNSRSQKFYRIANEVPTLLMIGIVILVVVKPF